MWMKIIRIFLCVAVFAPIILHTQTVRLVHSFKAELTLPSPPPRSYGSTLSCSSWIRPWKCTSDLLSNLINNKKVLLRERKRHTAHHVASPWGDTYLGWGVPTLVGGPTLAGGYLPWPGGTYLSWTGWGTSHVNWQTNWNYYLPHPSDAGGKNVATLCITAKLNFVLTLIRVYVKSFETKVAMEGLLHFVSGKTVKIPEDKGDPQKVRHHSSRILIWTDFFFFCWKLWWK